MNEKACKLARRIAAKWNAGKPVEDRRDILPQLEKAWRAANRRERTKLRHHWSCMLARKA